MNFAENLTQHLPFGPIKLIFSLKLVTESLDFIKSYDNFDKTMLK